MFINTFKLCHTGLYHLQSLVLCVDYKISGIQNLFNPFGCTGFTDWNETHCEFEVIQSECLNYFLKVFCLKEFSSAFIVSPILFHR